MCAQYHTLGLGHTQTCRSCPKVAVLHRNTTDEGWDPQRLVILVLKSPFCKHKTTGDGWDPQRLVNLVLKSTFCKYKTTGECWNRYRLVTLVLKCPF